MSNLNHIKRRRGRPPKDLEGFNKTRSALIRSGLVLMTEKGFLATGLDEILGSVNVPKGSFYHYFASKEEFGLVLMENYGSYFNRMIDRFLLDEIVSPITRFKALILHLRENMVKYDFKRGCLIGNLGQEMGALPASYRPMLIDIFNDWEYRVATCLKEGQKAGEISADLDCDRLAEIFWIGWEGAVLRAKLERGVVPLDRFSEYFIKMMTS